MLLEKRAELKIQSNSLPENKETKNNKQQESRRIQIIYQTSTRSVVMSYVHCQDMHPEISWLSFFQTFFLLDAHLWICAYINCLWHKRITASDKPSQIKHDCSFQKGIFIRQHFLTPAEEAQGSKGSKQTRDPVQTAFTLSYCTLMILGCCSFNRIEIS